MKTGYIVALAMLGGIGIGAVGDVALTLRPNRPCTWSDLLDVSNMAGYAKEYLPPATASIKAHGGVTLAAGPGTVMEGSPPGTRFVILKWDSMEQLKGWRNSPEYTAAHKDGEKYAKFNVVAVNGVP